MTGISINVTDSDWESTSTAEPLYWDFAQALGTKMLLGCRPRQLNLYDFSAYGRTISVKGAPIGTAQGVTGSNANGLSTNTPATASFTALVVMNLQATAAFSTGGELMGIGNFANPTGSDNDYGWGLGLTISNDSSGTVNFAARSRFFTQDKSLRTGDVSIGTATSSVHKTDTVMLALTVDAATETIYTQVCGHPSMFTTRTEAAGGVSGRALGGNIQVATTITGNTPPANGFVEVFEAIFSQPLTQQEIQEQYDLTKAALAAVGITLF